MSRHEWMILNRLYAKESKRTTEKLPEEIKYMLVKYIKGLEKRTKKEWYFERVYATGKHNEVFEGWFRAVIKCSDGCKRRLYYNWQGKRWHITRIDVSTGEPHDSSSYGSNRITHKMYERW